jgi:hypothetical protein
MGITLAALAGCHLCHKRKHAAAYIEGDPCGCPTAVAAPVGSTVPLTYEAVAAPQSNAVPPAPPKPIAGPPQG